jgi:hypothetical protein
MCFHTTIIVLLYQNYGFYHPFSGSFLRFHCEPLCKPVWDSVGWRPVGEMEHQDQSLGLRLPRQTLCNSGSRSLSFLPDSRSGDRKSTATPHLPVLKVLSDAEDEQLNLSVSSTPPSKRRCLRIHAVGTHPRSWHRRWQIEF